MFIGGLGLIAMGYQDHKEGVEEQSKVGKGYSYSTRIIHYHSHSINCLFFCRLIYFRMFSVIIQCAISISYKDCV